MERELELFLHVHGILCFKKYKYFGINNLVILWEWFVCMKTEVYLIIDFKKIKKDQEENGKWIWPEIIELPIK